MSARAPRFIGLGALLLAGTVLPAERSTGWTEVRTAHVTVKTNLAPAEAQRAALMAERMRTAMLAAAWPGAKLLQPEHIELMVLADHVDFVRYFGDSVSGAILEGGYPPPPSCSTVRRRGGRAAKRSSYRRPTPS